MKIGVFGGTFDPIHVGHMLIAEEARVRLRLERVLFIPAGQPWLKADRWVSGIKHRMAMVAAAIEDNRHFELCDMEAVREGPSYTVDTLVELRRLLGSSAELYLILGCDALEEMDRWREPERIHELSRVVAIPRPGFQVKDHKSRSASRSPVFIDAPLISVSGADIRARVTEGLSIKYMVPAAVEDYIARNGLYREGADASE